MNLARPRLPTLAHRRALPVGAADNGSLARAGETLFPPRAPFFQRRCSWGNLPVPPGPFPVHRPETGR
jgi:hypothetical protein